MNNPRAAIKRHKGVGRKRCWAGCRSGRCSCTKSSISPPSDPGQEIVSRTVEGPIHRTNYREVRQRSLKVAKSSARGVKLGDRVATLAWNSYRHLEIWYGIAGTGAIYHTVNPRLFPEQIAWIMNHAEDKIAFVDLTFVPLLEAIAATTDGRALHRADRRRAHAGDQTQECGRLGGMDRRGDGDSLGGIR